MKTAGALAKIASQVAVCTNCALHEGRKYAVAGEGAADAEIMLVSEAPGFHENEQGRPFAGAAGAFLDELLAQAGLTREEVFITHVVKCRTPGNRDPLAEEFNACHVYLQAQIDAINPSIIVTLGRSSSARYFPGAMLSVIHGQMKRVGKRFMIPMFHPAAALHQDGLKPSIMAAFANLPNQLEEARSALNKKDKRPVKSKKEPGENDNRPKQLNLF